MNNERRWIRRFRWLPALLLAVVVLAPYYKLLIGAAIPIPDDIFVSDLVDGEFPGRVEAARLANAGQGEGWTSKILTGMPCGTDPVTLALFRTLPPAMALGWLLSLMLVEGAIGAYLLARQLGASRSGAFLAGFAFSWSGFFVCQLRHLGIMGVVSLFPLGLFFLERAAVGLARDRRGARALPAQMRFGWLVAFGIVYWLQIQAGFPQSAYISALVYGALVAARCIWLLAPGEGGYPWKERISPALILGAGALVSIVLGALAGGGGLVSLWELGAISDRSAAASFEWATRYNYWGPNVYTFFVPYINGDISNMTYMAYWYEGTSPFWEDYGYVGFFTMLLALVASVVHARRFAVAFWAATGYVAYLLVLGKLTPLYKLAFNFLPGLSIFRFPTRFLFVVELALALLAGLGLTWLQDLMGRRVGWDKGRWLSAAVAALLVSVTAADLIYHNQRQNPLADAERWLAPPKTASLILASGEEGRVYTPDSLQQHIAMFDRSKGWSGDLSLYYAHRELLQPNSNLLHGVATLDGYSGISPRWTVDLIGDHSRLGLVSQLYRLSPRGFEASPAFFDWLEALSVRWLILPMRCSHPRLVHVASAPPAELYRLPGTMPRARVVGRARMVPTMEELWPLVTSGQINPRGEVLLHDPEAAPVAAALARDLPDGEAGGAARIVVDHPIEVVIDASAPRGGLLLLADNYYPGWVATVDGRTVPVLRANIAHRAVSLPPGNHRVAFEFRPKNSALSTALNLTGMGALALGALVFWGLAGWKGRPTAKDKGASAQTTEREDGF